MTEHLKLWDAVRRPPEDALKGFKRGGGFAGTAIKPMWSIKIMTEHFGPCGEGWGMNEPHFTVHPVGNEILVYCTVSVWHTKRENLVFGVGGDKILISQSSGLRSVDEAFKKAYTDALTIALKHLGVGADIHMGLWDGSKYAADNDEQPQEKTIAHLPPIHNNSKTNSRDEFQKLCKEVEDMASLDNLRIWKMKPENIERMEALNGDFADTFRNSYMDKVNALKKAMVAA